MPRPNKTLSKKKLIVFDLDGTLTETKSDLEADMAEELRRLLKSKQVAVIGGGTYQQFKKQFVSRLHCPPALLSRLYLFPTTATSFYRYRHGWKKVYVHELSAIERKAIKVAFNEVLQAITYVHPKKVYGKVIEDRKTQVTFSALGQDIVAQLGNKGVKMKEEWVKKNRPLKVKIARLVQKSLPKLHVHASGFTSIDVTRKGIDKAYGVRQIEKKLHVKIKDMVFIGDALFPGGNDYAARKSGIDCIPVKGPQDTKRVISSILRS